jgi:hypothetical protein
MKLASLSGCSMYHPGDGASTVGRRTHVKRA